MTIEEASIQFLENQIEHNYKDFFEQYLINDVEWLEMGTETRPIARIMDVASNKLLNIIVLFPPFKYEPKTK
jgi:hypothetical protein|tara:strand:+ start:430 stop:645 length:216 start_codon:yes stop_codon:yes gene_type:complete